MRNKTVYAGSVRHEDCDPFITVISLERKKCQETLDRILKDEYADMNNYMECSMCQDDNCVCEHDSANPEHCQCHAPNDLCDTGPMPFTLADIKRYIIYHGEWREKLRDLLQDGVAYV